MYADVIVICDENRKQVDKKPGDVHVCAGKKMNENQLWQGRKRV